MSVIKLDVEQMLQIASKYEVQSSEVYEMVKRLDQMLVELQTFWEGASAVRFERNYLDVKPSIVRLQEVILETSKAIKHTAYSISEVDNVVLQ